MGVLADLVPRSQPALIDDGAKGGEGAEGTSWLWEFEELQDDTGAPINLTTVTGTCKILTKDLATVIATLAFAGAADGTFTLSLASGSTVGLAGGSTQPRFACWYLKLAVGTEIVQLWMADNSPFTIHPAGA